MALSNVIERGFLFLANVFSARLTGAENYGTYGLALQTAGILASHASLGIGLVATRFAAEYPQGHPDHRAFVQRILQLSFGLALLSSVLMLALAWPLAHWLFDQPGLYPVLQVALLTAPVFVMFEAIRGLFVGHLQYFNLVVLSASFGSLMLVFLPLAANSGPRWMIIAHALCAFLAIAYLLVRVVRRLLLHLFSPSPSPLPLRRMLRFGMMQLGSGTAVSLVMMWLMALLVRYQPPEEALAASLFPLGTVVHDGLSVLLAMGALLVPYFGLREVGYFNAASSIRNLTSLLPGLLLQVSYSLMTDQQSKQYGGARRVVLINTWLSALYLVPIAGLGMAIMPWLLPFFFGAQFTEGVTAACILLATATVHTVSQAAVNRLSIVRLRVLAWINLVWVMIAGLLGWYLVSRHGAGGVALTLFIAHAATMLLVPLALRWLGELPKGLWTLTLLGLAGAIIPLAIALRSQDANLFSMPRLGMIATAALITLLIWLFRRTAVQRVPDAPA